MDKSGIKNFAIEARKVLRESAIKKAGYYGITIDNISEPVQKLTDSQVFKTIAGDEIRLYKDDLKKRNNLIAAIKNLGFEQVIEETAYTWFNRLIAIRFMEINNYLPSRVRVLSSEAGGSTPDIVRDVMELDLNLSQAEIDNIRKAKDENRYDDAFQMLFIKQCNELNAVLPGLFEKTDDYMELLLDLSYTGDGVVRMLTTMIPEDDFNVEKEGQVEIIGWLYQYYNTELKDDTFDKLKKNIKITKERIPAATQLFTPDWIVRYMVENSLGRVWIDHLRAVDSELDEKLKAEEFGWKYYLPEAKQEDTVAAELVKLRSEYKDITPQDILCIDPCSGSGHILVYMFDVLLQIYESEGISERDAAFDILENNIFGLDIDKRAYQLSYFALMMKARAAVGRRFFRGLENESGERRPVLLNVYAIDESNGIDESILDVYGVSMPSDERKKAEEQVVTLLSEMHDAKEYGSIINVTDFDMELVRSYLTDRDESGQLNITHMNAGKIAEKIWNLAMIGKALAQKYDVVVTNPPYMGYRGMSGSMANYITKEYPDSKSDLFAVFIERCNQFASLFGIYSMITQHSWMFIAAYEKVREKIYNYDILNMLHLGARAFDEIAGEVVQTTSFTQRKSYIDGYIGVYNRLVDGSNEANKEKLYLQKDHVKYATLRDFSKIPGIPTAYWVSEEALNVYDKCILLGKIAPPRTGMTTGDNNLFLRFWAEVNFNRTSLHEKSADDAMKSEKKWFPYCKGGGFRRYYGFMEYLVNWENDGYEIKNNIKENGKKAASVRSENLYFKPLITWSAVSTGKFSCRFCKDGALFDSGGSSIYVNKNDLFILGLLNSKVSQYYLDISNATINYQPGDAAGIPVLLNPSKEIDGLVHECINISKKDWDSFETSWDFERHPMISVVPKNHMLFDDKENIDLAECFACWENECNGRFERLKKNEEELNRIFIDIYGLQDELTPEVEDKDITVRKADLSRDIKSLISFAVGCMFGRYSLDEEGLIYAGGEFDKSKYKSFSVDDDAIIPITDEEYFDDDIVKRFVEFVSVVYGKDNLEENLNFIADALGNKGDSSRDVIRNYFLNDFFKDHAKTYSVTGSGKRPIYWLFDSGKQNGFKCLIYLHRYTPDTVGLIRSVYLKKASDAIQKALDNAEYIIANTESNVDRAMATKKRDKYVKQLAEIKPYYQALSHVAMQRIELDLDDGVKVNYAKFQGIEVGGDGEKKQTINLLAKI